MSLAILSQVYDEMRRLAIAGSVVAGGDFRLKKLIPALEQLGAKAPVFAKVAEAAQAVVDGTEQTSARSLLELTTLVSAILYTQGETGASGKLEPIETTDLSLPATQASASVLKPLLEALTSTGSGRLELIKDAHERGAFRDLRLVRPALGALDDPYGEIADFIAEDVLPIYGKAILADLRTNFDAKGKGGHPRRLRLMHALDPQGSREIVRAALEGGSPDVKVVAIECLGGTPEDILYLLEQTSAKAREVRQAAYRALAACDDDAALAALAKAMQGKDLELASEALRKSRSPKLLAQLLAVINAELGALSKTKEKKDVSAKIDRLMRLMSCLSGRDDASVQALLLNLFEKRGDLARIKGDSTSGADFNSTVIAIMERSTEAVRRKLVEAHATLEDEDLAACHRAAQMTLEPEEVYDIFSRYVTAKVNEKKKGADPAWAKRKVIFDSLGAGKRSLGPPPVDPRWLDLAVQLKDIEQVRRLIRPGHAQAQAFLEATFNDILKKAKRMYDCCDIVGCLIDVGHPRATDAFLAVLQKFGKSPDTIGYWFGGLIFRLPKAALPRLEAAVAGLNETMADSFLSYLQQLRDKP